MKLPAVLANKWKLQYKPVHVFWDILPADREKCMQSPTELKKCQDEFKISAEEAGVEEPN